VDGYRDGDYYFGGGGGGASGVRRNNSSNTLLLIAGGGGGGGFYSDQKLCTPGQASTSGSSPDGVNTAASGGNNGSDGNSSGGGKGYNNGWSMGGGSGAASYTTDQWGDVDHHYSFGGGGGGYSGGDGAYNNDYGGGGGGSYKSGDDSGWLSGGDENQTHTGAGEVVIELLEYRPCSTDTCQIDTSSYVSASTSKVACTGLPANAVWWPNKSGLTPPEVTQSKEDGVWDPSNAGSYSATDPGSTANVCKYHCATNFAWYGSSCTNVKTNVSCGTLPANAEWNTVSEITQNWNGSTWIPAASPAYNETPSATECHYKCKSGYIYEDGQCKNQKTVSCSGLPAAHAHWTSNNGTSKSITQNWTPENGWQPSSAGSENSSTEAGKCYFQCNKNYTYNASSNTCVADKKLNQTCTNLPAANALWWSNGSTTAPTITQTWDEDHAGCDGTNCWYPTTVGSNQNSGATNQCYFHCKTNYTYSASGNKCEANTQSGNCSSKPANSSWNDSGYNHKNVAGTFTQTWNGSIWDPASYTSAYSTTPGICIYQCNYNYNWNNSQSSPSCDPQHQSGTCSTKPANTVWNDGGGYSGSGTFEQIWNGSIFNPATFTSVYSPTTATVCGYKCADGYHTENGGKTCCAQGYHTDGSGTTCIKDERTEATCDAKDANAVWNDSGKNGKFRQTWDYSTSSWTPASHSSSRSTTAGECVYKCPDDATNGHFVDDPNDAKKCVGKTVNGTCTDGPANTTVWTPNKINTTWTNTSGSTWNWVPSTTSTYSVFAVSDECHFHCNSGYLYVNGSCKKKSWSFEDSSSDYPSDLVTISTSGTYAWQRSTSIGGNTGSNAMCSGNHNVHSTTSTMTLTVNMPSAGSISFYAKGKGEGSSTYYDWFKMTLDGTQQIYTTDLSSAWTKYSYSLSAGSHTLVFDYRKDSSVSNEPDMFCIDDFSIDLPSSATSLVHLKLDEGTGSSTANSGYLGSSYSVSGGSWSSSGKRGKAYNFTGSTIITTGVSTTSYPNDFTMMAWVKVSSGSTITLPSQSSSGTNGTSGQHYVFGANHESSNAGAGLSVGTNGIFVTAHGDSYMPPLVSYSNSSIGTDWHHVAVVFSNRTPYLYLDGTLVKTGNASSRTVYPPKQVGGGSYGYFNGLLDDVIIIGSALSAADIQAEYNR